MMQAEQVATFLTAFCQWARAQADLLAAALVGSYARGTATPASDVDLVILARDPARYVRDPRWVEQFGAVARLQPEDYGALISLRVWYVDGREIEFGITGAGWADLPLDEGSRRVMADGMRILFECGPLLSRHQAGMERPKD